jgi:hypothetical protein
MQQPSAVKFLAKHATLGKALVHLEVGSPLELCMLCSIVVAVLAFFGSACAYDAIRSLRYPYRPVGKKVQGKKKEGEEDCISFTMGPKLIKDSDARYIFLMHLEYEQTKNS